MCYAIRDGDGSEGGELIESFLSNARHAVGSTVVGNGFGNSDRVF